MNTDSSQTEKIDALRAGLHVDDVDFKDTCTPRLMDQQNAYWRRVIETLEEDVDRDRATCNRLRILRRRVLNGECPQRPAGRSVPQIAAGAVAGAALMVGAAMWWDTGPRDPDSVTRTASIEGTNVDRVAIDSAEIANNIDFYTWLEDQTDTVADSGGN